MYESRVEQKKNATTRERMSLDRSLLQDLQGVSQETKEHEWSLRNLRQDWQRDKHQLLSQEVDVEF